MTKCLPRETRPTAKGSAIYARWLSVDGMTYEVITQYRRGGKTTADPDLVRNCLLSALAEQLRGGDGNEVVKAYGITLRDANQQQLLPVPEQHSVAGPPEVEEELFAQLDVQVSSESPPESGGIRRAPPAPIRKPDLVVGAARDGVTVVGPQTNAGTPGVAR